MCSFTRLYHQKKRNRPFIYLCLQVRLLNLSVKKFGLRKEVYPNNYIRKLSHNLKAALKKPAHLKKTETFKTRPNVPKNRSNTALSVDIGTSKSFTGEI